MKTAMILAAGRGERLKPMTDGMPKALCCIEGIPLIEYHVINLAKAGFKRLVINHAYLGDQIRRHLGNGARWGVEICYVPEPPGGLETGGGIFNALPIIQENTFITVNADIFTDFDFASCQWPKRLVHLILVPKPPYFPQGDFGLSEKQQLNNNAQDYTFAGIACYRTELFKNNRPGRYSITPLLRQLATDQQATGEIYQGVWFDIGTPDRLKASLRR
jgi:MurNAc alpha-1-phosphate uridylyltransferase